jgi:cell division protein ZapA (FtsZ GTPase activity inhibitor)
MKLSEKELSELKSSKSETVKKLFSFYKRIVDGDFYEAYVASIIQFDSYLSDLRNNPQCLNSEDKGFERSILVMKGMRELLEGINYLRIQLTADQQDEAKREAVTLYDKARQMIKEKE